MTFKKQSVPSQETMNKTHICFKFGIPVKFPGAIELKAAEAICLK
jgi:hypothetical protein